MMEDDVALEGSLQELLATPSLKWIFVGGVSSEAPALARSDARREGREWSFCVSE